VDGNKVWADIEKELPAFEGQEAEVPKGQEAEIPVR
jgi:glycyl-tRNA synthetase